MSIRPCLLGAAVLLCVGAAPLAAQACSTNNRPAYPKTCLVASSVQWTLPLLVQMTVGPTTAVGAVTPAELLAGAKVAVGPTVTVQANSGVTVSIHALAAVWTASGGANPAKPAREAAWSTSSAGPWTPLGVTPVPLFSSTTGVAGTAPVTLWYRVQLSGADWPGGYTLPVRLTLSAP